MLNTFLLKTFSITNYKTSVKAHVLLKQTGTCVIIIHMQKYDRKSSILLQLSFLVPAPNPYLHLLFRLFPTPSNKFAIKVLDFRGDIIGK